MRRTVDRLRSPEPFGKAGLAVAILALVLAITGAAFAAAALNGKQKKEVEKIAKKFAGKPGAPGANGTSGANGKDGTNGSNGAPGSNGTSATAESFVGNAHGCTVGGVLVKSASPEVAVCNGKNGTNGTNGQTGFTETLPPEMTETGTYAFGQLPIEPSETLGFEAQISFNIPLSEAVPAHFVTRQEQAGTPPAECPGTFETPVAESGSLCVYEKFHSPGGAVISTLLINPNAAFALGAGVNGAVLQLELENTEVVPGSAFGYGVWAVTAPAEP